MFRMKAVVGLVLEKSQEDGAGEVIGESPAFRACYDEPSSNV